MFRNVRMPCSWRPLTSDHNRGKQSCGNRWFHHADIIPSYRHILSPGTPAIAASNRAISSRSFSRTESEYETYFPPADARQAVQQKLVRLEERDGIEVRFRLNALQRANPGTRYASYAQALQNGFLTRNEVRALEDLEPMDGADQLTAQSNLVPLDQLGQNPSREETMLGEPVRQ